MHHSLRSGLNSFHSLRCVCACIRRFGCETGCLRFLAPRIHFALLLTAIGIGIVRGIASTCQVATLHIHRKVDELAYVCRHERVRQFLVLILCHGIYPDHDFQSFARNGNPHSITPRQSFQCILQFVDVARVMVDVNHQVSGETHEVHLGVSAHTYSRHHKTGQEILDELGPPLVTPCRQGTELFGLAFPSVAADGGYKLRDGHHGVFYRLVGHVIGTLSWFDRFFHCSVFLSRQQS